MDDTALSVCRLRQESQIFHVLPFVWPEKRMFGLKYYWLQVSSSTSVIVAPCPGEKIDLAGVFSFFFYSLVGFVSCGAAVFCQHSDIRVGLFSLALPNLACALYSALWCQSALITVKNTNGSCRETHKYLSKNKTACEGRNCWLSVRGIEYKSTFDTVCFVSFYTVYLFKGYVYDIQSINIAAICHGKTE